MERVLLDENVRGLARWLRFLGFDARAAKGELDSELLVQAEGERRVLFTRDRELAARGAMFLAGNSTPKQLAATMACLGWPPEEEWFSRCTVCNELLHDLPASDQRVCDRCGRVYWKGSHFDRAQAFLRRIRASA